MAEVDFVMPTKIQSAEIWWEFLLANWNGTEQEPKIKQLISKLNTEQNITKYRLRTNNAFNDCFVSGFSAAVQKIFDEKESKKSDYMIRILTTLNKARKAGDLGIDTTTKLYKEELLTNSNTIQLTYKPIGSIELILEDGRRGIGSQTMVMEGNRLKIKQEISDGTKIKTSYQYTKLPFKTYRALQALDVLVASSYLIRSSLASSRRVR